MLRVVDNALLGSRYAGITTDCTLDSSAAADLAGAEAAAGAGVGDVAVLTVGALLQAASSTRQPPRRDRFLITLMNDFLLWVMKGKSINWTGRHIAILFKLYIC